MEFNNDYISVVNDDPCEGKVFKFPQCLECKNNVNGICEAFKQSRRELLVSGVTDIFKCDKFSKKFKELKDKYGFED